MDRILGFLALLVVFAVAAMGVPIGLAVADTWNAGTTSSIITAGAATCGGSIGLVALVVGVAVGVRVVSGRSRTAPDERYQVNPSQGTWKLSGDPYRAAQTARMEAQAAREMLKLQQEQQQLLSPPSQPAGWEIAPDWEVVDSSTADSW